MRTFVKIMGIIVLLLILAGIGFMSFLNKDIKAMEEVIVGTVDLSLVEDGTYLGEFEEGRFSNKVEVIVEAGVIVEINIIDTVTFERTEVTEEMIEQIVIAQSLDIDGIAGATNTINAYLKAIENALKG